VTEDGLRLASSLSFVSAPKHEIIVMAGKLGLIFLGQVFKRVADFVVRHILGDPSAALDARADLLVFSIHFSSTFFSMHVCMENVGDEPEVPFWRNIMAENRDK